MAYEMTTQAYATSITRDGYVIGGIATADATPDKFPLAYILHAEVVNANTQAALEAALTAASTASKKVDGAGRSITITSAITIPAGVALDNITITNTQTANPNMMLLVNSGCYIGPRVKLIGTGAVSRFERGIYPVADTINDVEIHADISNMTCGIQAQYITSSATRCKRWRIYGYIHDIVGTSGSSEGYGILLSPATDFVIRTTFYNIKRHAVYLSSGTQGCDVDVNIDTCYNYAIQLYAEASTDPVAYNKVRARMTNLSYDPGLQTISGGVGLITNTHYNDVSVIIENAGSINTGVWVEGRQDVGGMVPKWNDIHGCILTGTYFTAAVKFLNADRNTFRDSIVNATVGAAAITLTEAGSNASVHSGWVYNNKVLQVGSAQFDYANYAAKPFLIDKNYYGGAGGFTNSGGTNTAWNQAI